MIKIIYTTLFAIGMISIVKGQNAKAKLVSSFASIKRLKVSNSDGFASIIQDVKVDVIYWNESKENQVKDDLPLNFVITNSSHEKLNVVIVSNKESLTIPKEKFRNEPDRISFTLHVKTDAINPSETEDESFAIQLDDQNKGTDPKCFVLLVSNPISSNSVALNGTQAFIKPFFEAIRSPQQDTVSVNLLLTGDYQPENSHIHFKIDTTETKGFSDVNPRISNANYTISKDAWEKANGSLTIKLVVKTETSHKAEHGYWLTKKIADFVPKSFNIIIEGQSIKSDVVKVWLNEEGTPNTGAKTSNLLVGSFIKTISGSSAQSELLDLFIKINLTSKSGLDNGKRLWFGMWGVDAGLLADSSRKTGLPLNEAMLSLNMVFSKMDNNSSRVGFIGGGFKQFFGDAYLGGHIGILGVGGMLRDSYILTGFYYSPWLKKVDAHQYQNDSSTSTKYRNNIYFEAAFNAFSEIAPKPLQLMRLKFGLMLPVSGLRDADLPTNKDFLYRLAVEIPIGGAYRW